MNKLISLVLLVAGISLLIYGANASDSLGSDFSRFFTGSPTDKSMWMIIGGAAATVAGAVGLLFGRSKSS
jgi:hypothetical protein